MPHFVTQRSLYEARERPSKTYSWKAFMLSNIFVELPWNTLMAVIVSSPSHDVHISSSSVIARPAVSKTIDADSTQCRCFLRGTTPSVYTEMQ